MLEIKVPDIGDFDEVTVIELLVKVGDSIKLDQSLLTVESDKASMEIPSSSAGVVKEIRVKLGDKVKQGSVVLSLEAADSDSSSPSISPSKSSVPQELTGQAAPEKIASVAAPVAAIRPSSFAGTADLDCDLLVLGAGPGGYSAVGRTVEIRLK